jgi:hypothetical protein
VPDLTVTYSDHRITAAVDDAGRLDSIRMHAPMPAGATASTMINVLSEVVDELAAETVAETAGV